MNGQKIAICAVAFILAAGAAIWLRGYSDEKGWTQPA